MKSLKFKLSWPQFLELFPSQISPHINSHLKSRFSLFPIRKNNMNCMKSPLNFFRACGCRSSIHWATKINLDLLNTGSLYSQPLSPHIYTVWASLNNIEFLSLKPIIYINYVICLKDLLLVPQKFCYMPVPGPPERVHWIRGLLFEGKGNWFSDFLQYIPWLFCCNI